MALPKLETPEHSTILPSTNETVYFRPFLVGEQKALLIAQESENTKNQINEMMRLIDTCCKDIKADQLPVHDIEWLFLQIRIKSVGETSDIILRCEEGECNADNEVTIDLESAKLIKSEKEVSELIQLTPEISIELQYPGFQHLKNLNYDKDGNLRPNELFGLIGDCVISIIDGDEIHGRDDFSKSELTTFIDTMSMVMLDKIQEYFDNIPKLRIDVEYTCTVCQHKNTLELEGTQSFFG